MGLFKTKEEKQEAKEQKQQKKEVKEQEKEFKAEKKATFIGEALQPIGKIPAGASVVLSLKPDQEVLNIHYKKIDITLPYARIISFNLVDEVTLAKSGSGLGGAVVGGALFGTAGALIGQNAKKGKTKTKWIGTLTYKDKEGNQQEIKFIEWGMDGGYYTANSKQYTAAAFEKTVNNITSRFAEDVSEL